jgi:glutathione reductase (NADPH)
VATAGLPEHEARARHGNDIDIYRTEFRPMKYTLTNRDERAMLKLIVRRSDDRVIGIHMVGLDTPEIVQGFAVAMTAGATKADFDTTIGLHPTSAEELVTLREPTPPDEAERRHLAFEEGLVTA